MIASRQGSTVPKVPNIMLLLVRFREVGILFFTLLLILVASIVTKQGFLTVDNFQDILLNISILTIVGLAQMMVIITRGIDLSVGSTIGLVAMMVAFTMVAFPDLNPMLALLLGMALGAVLGSINAAIITWGNVPPIIATLGTLSIYRGLTFLYRNGDWINSFEMPRSLRQLSKGTPLSVPNLILIAVGIALLVFYFLRFTQAGRDIYAVGSNPDAAKVAGIRVERIIFMVYVLSGILCGLAGVLWASRFESAQTNTALGFELQTVAAPVVGGVNIFGGSGTVLGMVLGAFLLGVINNALTIVQISPFWQQAVQGLLILLAVIVDSTIMRRLKTMNTEGGA
jgi:rhamnose transport system permease protein